MGCGASQVDPNANAVNEKAILKQQFDLENNDKSALNQNGTVSNGNAHQNGHLPQTTTENNKKNTSALPPPLPAPKGVAFEVDFGGKNKIDSILSKHPPKHLQRLEPLNLPKLTAEDLALKMQKAEEKRKKKLESKKRKAKKSSKLRADIAKAQQFENAQTQQIKQAEERQRIAEENRIQKQREAEEKKRIREERRKKALERAAQIKKQEGAEEVDFEVEKDENFNKDDDVDSWLDGDNNNKEGGGLGDRIYSGRESPHKKVTVLGGGDIHRRNITSASTTDSFDYAFQRNGHHTRGPAPIEANSKQPDDFFDS